ncbi:DUF4142 domain-containing protein [Streptomyces sp. CC228A]|uniref:DUF4142 domain-containing protein n=1 Tax=Streptomyces sp. CC228A TaxID=2898186 RepID=UPI0022A8A301|nr:DUF4142 domain-containing protein [Streptomyces sp. CC228A]
MDDDTVMHTHRSRRAATALAALAAACIAAAPAVAADQDGGLPTDNAFLRAAHQANLAEIALSQDARKNATTACVKDVAAELERDHAKLDADVKALSDKLGVDLPLAPTAHQQQMLADVMAQKGTAAYDRAWLKTQDTVHRLTLKAIDHQVARGENRQITAAAKAARPVVAGHLERVEGGTCHGTAPARTIHAGSGGQAATVFAAGVPAAVAVPAVALGGALVAGGAFWTASRLRRNDLR